MIRIWYKNMLTATATALLITSISFSQTTQTACDAFGAFGGYAASTNYSEFGVGGQSTPIGISQNTGYTNEAGFLFMAFVITLNEQNIPLKAGWNIFSLAVAPGTNDMEEILQPLVTEGTLVKVQDETGKAFEWVFPMGWVNGLEDWSFTEGYKIKVNAATSLDVTGTAIPLPAEIPLKTGWNIFGYPVLEAQDAQEAVSALITGGTLIKVQDEAGLAIEYVFPVGWVYNIENFGPGEGYKIKVSSNDILVLDDPGSLKSALSGESNIPPLAHFKPVYEGYGLDHMNVYLTPVLLNGKPLEPGDEIGLFDGEHCVGAVVAGALGQPYFSLAASKDDPETGEKDGFTAGNPIMMKIWSRQHASEISVGKPVFLTGYTNSFDPLATTVASLDVTATGLPGGDGLITGLGDNYPNPFSEETTLEFTLGERSTVDISMYNLLGEKVRTLVHQTMESGAWTTVWDATDHGDTRVPPGIYICRMVAGDQVSVKSIELIR